MLSRFASATAGVGAFGGAAGLFWGLGLPFLPGLVLPGG
jgi:hypothetical protein